MILEWCHFGAIGDATMDADNFFRRIASSFVLLVVFCMVYLFLWVTGVTR